MHLQVPLAVDVKALNAERLARAQASMRKAGLPAALVFDPPTSVMWPVMASSSWPICTVPTGGPWFFAEHDPILWDFADQMHMSRSRWDGEIREASTFTFFGSGPNSRRDAASAVAEVISVLKERGLQHERLGVDRSEAVLFVELASQGVEVVDAVPVMETARAVKTPLELAIHRDNARLVDESMLSFLDHLTPGKTENEL